MVSPREEWRGLRRSENSHYEDAAGDYERNPHTWGGKRTYKAYAWAKTLLGAGLAFTAGYIACSYVTPTSIRPRQSTTVNFSEVVEDQSKPLVVGQFTKVRGYSKNGADDKKEHYAAQLYEIDPKARAALGEAFHIVKQQKEGGLNFFDDIDTDEEKDKVLAELAGWAKELSAEDPEDSGVATIGSNIPLVTESEMKKVLNELRGGRSR